MKKLLILILAVILFSACERKSGKLLQEKKEIQLTEKVVILDMETPIFRIDNVDYNRYRVKRIDLGVVAFINETGLFQQGDTILVYKTQYVGAR